MNLTVFDILDGGLVAAVIATAFACRANWAVPPVAGLVAYHAIGRWVAFQTDDPLPLLMVLQMLAAVSFHFGAFFTIYARLIGSAFAVLALSSAVGTILGIVPANGGGLAFDLWNFQSVVLHGITFLMMVGIIRHDSILARNRAASRAG